MVLYGMNVLVCPGRLILPSHGEDYGGEVGHLGLLGLDVSLLGEV